MANSYLVIGGNLDLRYQAALKTIRKEINDKEWAAENNPDFFLLDLATTIGIDEIRDLQNRLGLKPFGCSRQVSLILRAENLSVEAQNSLLKTIEEPPGKALIVLTCPEASLLLPTIASRCQIVRLPVLPQINLDKEEESIYQKMIKRILSSPVGERWQILEEAEIANDRLKAIEWLDKLTFVARKLLIEEVEKEKKPTSSESLYFALLSSLSKTKFYLEANTNVRLTLENFLLDLPLLSC